jgi:radical SAM superfamily enzyme YgiQ (UPF0313 family)
MRIAFLQASHTHKRFNENFQVVDRHFGVFPDIGMLTAAAVARDEGAEVRLWDAYAARKSLEETEREIREWGPDLLAMAFHSIPTIQDALAWARRIKSSLGVPLLLGGHEASRYPREIMTHDVVDYLIVGPAWRTLPQFLDALSRDEGYEEAEGLVWRMNGSVVINPPPDDMSTEGDPPPARELLDNTLYYSHVTQRGLYTVLLTSRGCPFGCAFCAVARSGYHPRPVDEVVDEMEGCIRAWDIHEIDLFDPLLLHDKGRVMDLCSEIRSRGLDMEWACRSRIDDPDEEMLRAAADAGCRRIYYGIESGDPGILRRINKRIDLDSVARTIEMTTAHGIRPLGFFQIGSPGETVRTARRTMRFALDLPLDYAQFMRTIAKPGSRLEDLVKRVTGTDPWREYVLGERDDSRLPTPWTRLSPRTVDRLVREAYMRFYLRPRIAAKTLIKARSAGEARRYVGVGLSMMLSRSDG